MVQPRKVPREYVRACLETYETNHGDNLADNVNLDGIESHSTDGLVSIAKLKKLFRTHGFYKSFKDVFLTDIPDSAWQYYHRIAPTNTAKKYARKYMSSSSGNSSSGSGRKSSTAGKKKRLQIKAYRDKKYQYSDGDEELSHIKILGDTSVLCDDTDVNFPKPICASVRNVCREYDPSRRYTKISPDGSENHLYDFDVIIDGQENERRRRRPVGRVQPSRRPRLAPQIIDLGDASPSSSSSEDEFFDAWEP